MNLQDQIEAYLLAMGDWCPARQICDRFDLRERALRGLDGSPGLCTLIAISGNKGYKHVTLATTSEWLEHYNRERKHNIMALVNLRKKRQLRLSVSRQIQHLSLQIEKDSGQIVMQEIIPIST